MDSKSENEIWPSESLMAAISDCRFQIYFQWRAMRVRDVSCFSLWRRVTLLLLHRVSKMEFAFDFIFTDFVVFQLTLCQSPLSKAIVHQGRTPYRARPQHISPTGK